MVPFQMTFVHFRGGKSYKQLQDAGYAAHILQIPSVALLTTAGPGSLAAAMYLGLKGFSVFSLSMLMWFFEESACRKKDW